MAETTERFSWLMLLLLSCPCPLSFIEGKTLCSEDIADRLSKLISIVSFSGSFLLSPNHLDIGWCDQWAQARTAVGAEQRTDGCLPNTGSSSATRLKIYITITTRWSPD